MQVRTIAGYWYNRGVTSPTPLLSELFDGYGEVVVDVGQDGIIDSGGAQDFIITPRGASGDLDFVAYRELTLRNDSGQSFKIDVVYMNSATNSGSPSQLNTGAAALLDISQYLNIPNDPTLRVVSHRDYSDANVPFDYLSQRGVTEDTAGASTWMSGLPFHTLNMAGNRADYTLARDAEKVLKITAKDGIVDHATGYERVAFKDGVLAFDTHGNAGEAYRIYQAAFDRTPDLGGLSHWIREMDDGTPLNRVAELFLGSAEFTQVYGSNVSNNTFVATLYRNILDRDGEPDGVNYWVGELNSGRTDRVAVLVGFSESGENIGKLQPLIESGIWFV